MAGQTKTAQEMSSEELGLLLGQKLTYMAQLTAEVNAIQNELNDRLKKQKEKPDGKNE